MILGSDARLASERRRTPRPLIALGLLIVVLHGDRYCNCTCVRKLSQTFEVCWSRAKLQGAAKCGWVDPDDVDRGVALDVDQRETRRPRKS